MRESQIESYLTKRVKELGGEVRKVQWVGRRSAPDRLVMLPARPGNRVRVIDVNRYREQHQCSLEDAKAALMRPGAPAQTIWVEVKNPETIKTFPADARERAQAREHARMRAMGQRVEVIGTIEQVDELLG